MTPMRTLCFGGSILLVGAAAITACAEPQHRLEPSETIESSQTAIKTQNRIEIKIVDENRCFSANGLPNHPTGTFPNRGNPNAIAEQNVQVCVPLFPSRAETMTKIRGTMGIAVNGVQFRPNTAGFYDPNGRRGHSRNGDRNWSVDIHGAPGKLGLDFNNAHVGRGGLYHYHGIAEHLLDSSGSTLIGYAGDGYEIHYVGEAVESGWELKTGNRPSGPGGEYNGQYNEDFIYVGGYDANGQSRLDECNGGDFNGRYVYFVTDSYPYVSRCLTGAVSPDFNKSNHRAEGRRNGAQRGRGQRQRGERPRGNRRIE